MTGTVSPEWNTHGACGWCADLGNAVPCWCADCHWKAAAPHAGTAKALRFHHMYLCPVCGNKRCPRAADHGWVCTGSNEPGQLGSPSCLT